MKNYKLVKNLIDPSLANFCYNYLLMKRKVVKHLIDTKFISPIDMNGASGPIHKYLILIHTMLTWLWKIS